MAGNGMGEEGKPAIGRRYGSSCPLPMAGHSVCCIPHPSHFAVPMGTAVWLATNI
ncbi:MAG: hypothetical protein IKI83_02255 [Prevotella sp.]|nr:hypothetical protein [Prevotella sp.]